MSSNQAKTINLYMTEKKLYLVRYQLFHLIEHIYLQRFGENILVKHFSRFVFCAERGIINNDFLFKLKSKATFGKYPNQYK